MAVSFSTSAWGANIATFGFNSSTSLNNGSVFVPSDTANGQKQGASNVGDYPSGKSYSVEGTAAYSVNNKTVTLTSVAFNTSPYSSVSLSLRLGAFSLGGTNNGLDSTDRVYIEVSPNNGATYYKEVEASGFNVSTVGAYWWYDATGVASRVYAASNTSTVHAPGGNGNRADGISTLTVTDLPSITNLRVRITLANNNTNELWVIDDFKLTGDVRPDRIWLGDDSTRGGAGTWTQTGGTAWTNGDADGNTGIAWDPTQTARFGGSGSTHAVVVSGTVDADSGLDFLSPGYALTGGTIRLTGASVSANAIRVASGVATIGSTLEGSHGLTKTGAGKLVLSGDATYTGQTVVSEGTLAVGAGLASESITLRSGATLDVSAASGFAIADGQSLAGSGQVMGTIRIDGELAPGASLGTLAFADALVLAGVSRFEIDDTTGEADQAIVTGAITFGGDLVVTDLGDGTGYFAGQVFDLFDFTSATGVFTSFSLPPLPDGLQWEAFDYTTGQLAVATPEPAMLSLLALATLPLRRRRRQ